MEVKKISEIYEDIDNLNVPKKEKAIKALISFIISFAIVIGPIALLVNLLIYNKMRGLISLGLLLLAVLFMVLVQKIYYDSIVRKRVENTNKLIIIPTMVVFTLGLIFILAMFYFEVI